MPASVQSLQLQDYIFDPLEGLPDLPEDLRLREEDSGKNLYFIIQFKKSLSQFERARLKQDYNLRLTEYLPRFAYLEKTSISTLANLSKESLYRTSVPFQPAFKIASGIGQQKFRTAERQASKELLLSALLFPDVETTPVVSALQEAKASDIKVLDDVQLGGVVRVNFKAPSTDLLPKIAQLAEVRWIEEVTELIEDNVNAAGTIQSGTAGNEPVWDRGLHGEGQIIGILDSAPLDIEHCFFKDPVDNTPRPDHRKVVELRNAAGSVAGGHATFVAGNAAGDDFNNPGLANRRGGAWASRLVSTNRQDLGGFSTLLTEFNAALAAGATIHSNSWHDNTNGAGNPALYNQTAADVDTFTWQNEDHLVLGSAGNNGEEQGPPGTAKNAICVAAAEADPTEMNLGDGNPGPTADGRLKPDLVAVGCGIQSATVGTACGTGPRANCATSYATPHAAAAAALVRQYYTEGWYPSGAPLLSDRFTPSGALLKATLLNSTLDMTGTGPGPGNVPLAGYPGNLEGWGLLRLDAALFFCGDIRNLSIRDVRNAEGLDTGESHAHQVRVVSDCEPLKVTLVWSDPPGAAGAANPVVNNLDLVVTSPDGSQTFLGNNFAGGVSVTGGAADALNTVEMVLVNNPMPGDWTVTVTGTEVNIGNPGQGYALVATGDLVKDACEVSIPIAVKLPIFTDVEVTSKQPECNKVPGFEPVYN